MSAITIIGVDCACEPKNVGLALASHSEGRTVVDEVKRGSRRELPAEVITEWISAREDPILLALDAPLGWPAPLGDTLAQHRAGDALEVDAHTLFRRETDRFVKQHLNQQSFDVGANLIARTAHAALELLGSLRRNLGRPIPLAWKPDFKGVAAIEVYPAATLKSHDIPFKGYKKARDVYGSVQEALGERLRLPSDAVLSESDHVLDAALCVLAAHDFLEGRALAPPNLARAQRESWIWVRDPEA